MFTKIITDDIQTGLSQFAETYNQYKALSNRNLEIDVTISILTRLRRWYQIVADVESALDGSQLGLGRQSLLTANNLILSLEKQTTMIAILPKMVAQKEALTASVNDAFTAQCDRIISFQ